MAKRRAAKRMVTVKVYSGPYAAGNANAALVMARQALQPYLCRVETRVLRRGRGPAKIGQKVALRTEPRCAQAFRSR